MATFLENILMYALYLQAFSSFLAVVAFFYWVSLPVCGGCDKKIYPRQLAHGISPPASCSIHKECNEVFRKRWKEEEPYKSILSEYKELLDKRDQKKLKENDWKNYYENRKAALRK